MDVKSIKPQIRLPLITVAMPIYNAGCHLRSAVLSIVSQTYPNWHLLIIDDGSTDNALKSIADLIDHRIRVICDGKNKGLAARLNEAIDLAEGDFFARMDQDDISYPERFKKQVEELIKDSELDLICTRALSISERDELVGYFPYQLSHSDITSKPWRGFYMPHPTWMGKIEWFKQHRYSVDSPYFCEDQELLLRTYETSKFICTDEILFAYRLRAKNKFSKLKKVRWVILNLQLVKFVKKRQIKFAFFSVFSFVLNILRDLLYSIFSVPYSPYKSSKVNSPDAKKYQNIKREIGNNGG